MKKIAETIGGTEIVVDDGIVVRDMDRNQVKALRKAGLDPAFATLDAEKSANLIDWILDNIYKDVDFTGIPYYKVSALAYDTYRRAMGGPEEIKNS